MPLQRSETYTTTGTKTSWNCDPSIVPFNASVVCILSATATYKLQYSFDVLDDPLLTDADATWFDSPDIPAGSATNAQAAFLAPVARVRVVIAALTGTLTMKMLQGLSTN